MLTSDLSSVLINILFPRKAKNGPITADDILTAAVGFYWNELAGVYKAKYPVWNKPPRSKPFSDLMVFALCLYITLLLLTAAQIQLLKPLVAHLPVFSLISSLPPPNRLSVIVSSWCAISLSSTYPVILCFLVLLFPRWPSITPRDKYTKTSDELTRGEEKEKLSWGCRRSQRYRFSCKKAA